MRNSWGRIYIALGKGLVAQLGSGESSGTGPNRTFSLKRWPLKRWPLKQHGTRVVHGHQ